MYKAAIFDLDGTVCDTLETIAYYANKSLKKYGLAPFEKEKYKYFVGDGAAVLVKRMLTERNVNSDAEFIDEFLNFYKNSYEEDSLYKTSVFKGINETIREMKKMNMKIGLVSNKPHGAVCDVVEKLFKKNTFDFYTGLKEDMLPKPNPNAVLKTAKYFEVFPDECMYIGDTNVDMQTGKNAKMFTVGVLWGFRDYDELAKNGADIIINSPSELIELAKMSTSKTVNPI